MWRLETEAWFAPVSSPLHLQEQIPLSFPLLFSRAMILYLWSLLRCLFVSFFSKRLNLVSFPLSPLFVSGMDFAFCSPCLFFFLSTSGVERFPVLFGEGWSPFFFFLAWMGKVGWIAWHRSFLLSLIRWTPEAPLFLLFSLERGRRYRGSLIWRFPCRIAEIGCSFLFSPHFLLLPYEWTYPSPSLSSFPSLPSTEWQSLWFPRFIYTDTPMVSFWEPGWFYCPPTFLPHSSKRACWSLFFFSLFSGDGGSFKW